MARLSHRFLSLLSGLGLIGMGDRLFPSLANPGHMETRYRIPDGKIYASRSRYTPGGPHRNCGDRGISPKSVARRQAQS